MRGKLKKKTGAVIIGGMTLLLAAGCEAHRADETVSANTANAVSDDTPGFVTISFPYVKQPGDSSNQFAVWVEDEMGRYVKTVFVTDFTALGGYESREDAVPQWVDKSGIREGTSENIDAVSGATPQTGTKRYEWECVDDIGNPVAEGEYKICVEGTVNKDSQVLYTADIMVGSHAMTAQAQPEYYELIGNTDMIGDVTVEYIPH